MRTGIIGGAVCALTFAAAANLENGDFEASQNFAEAEGWIGGGTAFHADFQRPNTPDVAGPGNPLGEIFGFYASGFNTMHQETALTYDAGWIYTFSSWATGGSNATGILNYQLGYLENDDFVEVASMAYNLDGIETWEQYDGVTAVISAGDAAVGRNVVVRFGRSGREQNADDMWVDNAVLTAIPGPGSVALLALAGVAGIRRRR